MLPSLLLPPTARIALARALSTTPFLPRNVLPLDRVIPKPPALDEQVANNSADLINATAPVSALASLGPKRVYNAWDTDKPRNLLTPVAEYLFDPPKEADTVIQSLRDDLTSAVYRKSIQSIAAQFGEDLVKPEDRPFLVPPGPLLPEIDAPEHDGLHVHVVVPERLGHRRKAETPVGPTVEVGVLSH